MGKASKPTVAEVDGRFSTEIVYLALGTLGFTTVLALFIWYTVQRVGLPGRETPAGKKEARDLQETDVANKPHPRLEDTEPDAVANESEKDEALPANGFPTGFQPSTSPSDDGPDADTRAEESRRRSQSLSSTTDPKEAVGAGRRATMPRSPLDTVASIKNIAGWWRDVADEAQSISRLGDADKTVAGRAAKDDAGSEGEGLSTAKEKTLQPSEARDLTSIAGGPITLPTPDSDLGIQETTRPEQATSLNATASPASAQSTSGSSPAAADVPANPTEVGSDAGVRDRCKADSSPETEPVPDAAVHAPTVNKRRKQWSMLDV